MPDRNKILTEHSINYFLIGPFGNVITNKTWGDLFWSLIQMVSLLTLLTFQTCPPGWSKIILQGETFFQQATILGLQDSKLTGLGRTSVNMPIYNTGGSTTSSGISELPSVDIGQSGDRQWPPNTGGRQPQQWRLNETNTMEGVIVRHIVVFSLAEPLEFFHRSAWNNPDSGQRQAHPPTKVSV